MTISGMQDPFFLTCLKIKDKAWIAAENKYREMWLIKLRHRDQIPRSWPHPGCKSHLLPHPAFRAVVKHSPRETFAGLISLKIISPLPSSPHNWATYHAAQSPGMSFFTKVEDWYCYFVFLPILKGQIYIISMSDTQFKTRHPTEKNTAIYTLQKNILFYF